MKRIIFIVAILVLSPSISSAQEYTSFIEVVGETTYVRTPNEYHLEVLVSEDLVYDSYNQSFFKEIKTNYFDKLQKAGIDTSKLQADSLAYNMLNYRKKGNLYHFKTTSIDEFSIFLSVYSHGIQIYSKKATFGLKTEQQLELMKKALADASQKASLMAKTINKSLGNIISIVDDRYLSEIDSPLYDVDERVSYKIKVRYNFL